MSKLERFNRVYGDGHLFGGADADDPEAEVRQQEEFFLMGDVGQARALAQSEACGVVEQLITERGATEMKLRYGPILFWGGVVMDQFAELGRPDLASAMTSYHRRQHGEPLGDHDPEWIPEELNKETFRSPMAYAIPRIIIHYMDICPDKRANFKVLTYLEEAVAKHPFDLIELTSHLLEQVLSDIKTWAGENRSYLAQAYKMIRFIVGQGKLDEDNQHHLYNKVFASLRRNSPTFNLFYDASIRRERQTHKIADETEIRRELPFSILEWEVDNGVLGSSAKPANGEVQTKSTEVQFSYEEIDEIANFREEFLETIEKLKLKSKPWCDVELYFPWAMNLSDREIALSAFTKLAHNLGFMSRRAITKDNDHQLAKKLSEFKTRILSLIRTLDVEFD